jgi:hypothetical protein
MGDIQKRSKRANTHRELTVGFRQKRFDVRDHQIAARERSNVIALWQSEKRGDWKL